PATEQTDRELLQGFTASRDGAAFAALVRRHGPLVLSVCRHVLRQEQDADGATAMVGTKAKLAVLVLLAGIIGGTVGLASSVWPTAAGEQANSEAKPNASSPQVDGRKPMTDAHGDPLPRGAIARFGSARWRHCGIIYASALSPDGKMLATAGKDSVMAWSLDTGKGVDHFACYLCSNGC